MGNTGNVVDAFQRFLAMLQIIPKHPRVIDGAEIERKLAARGIYVTRRTIQRDLEKLSGVVPIVSRQGKPLGWSWSKDAELFELPGMDAATALTFRLVELFLQNRLPSMVLDSIEPHLKRAHEILAINVDSGMARWPEKVAVVPRGMGFLQPTIAPSVLDVVYEALLLERRLNVRYRRRDEEVMQYSGLSPLGLVFVDGLIYLLGAFSENDFPRQFLLHRIVAAESLLERIAVPQGFTLKGYVASGEFAYPITDKRIKLKALFDESVAAYLRETPLNASQRLTTHKDGRILLETEVLDTVQLRYWLKGFGEHVEVVGPRDLRVEFEEMARVLVGRYAD